MGVSNIIALFGGVALFLFGMSLMGEHLKKVAGNELEMILFRLSNTPLKGLLLGTGVTAVVQSSSATSVMVVGFVNSGIMKLNQAISVILGSIIGTSITGWIICLSSIEGTGWVSLLSTSTLSAVIAVIGVILVMFVKGQKQKHIGNIMLGFSILMYGMQSMSGAVSPLRSDPNFISIITAFNNPALGIIAGAAFAAILQSASAAIGILQALSFTGVISFSVAFPIILGIGVGASVPVLMSAIGAKCNGKRAAIAYLIMSICGAVICGAIFYAADMIFSFTFTGSIINTVGIATVNTIFRAVTGIILIPFTGYIGSMLARIVKESEKEKEANADFERLDERLISHPEIAIEQSRIAVSSMASKAKNNVLNAIKLITDYSDEGYNAVNELEEYIDKYEDKVGTYLLKLNTNALTPHQNERTGEYLHAISDFERISDHAVNIAQIAQDMHSKKVVFSNAAQEELTILKAAIKEILDISIGSFVDENDVKVYNVEPLEERIDELCDTMKLRHVERMKKNLCTFEQGYPFNDLITNMERVSDHCSNIAIAMIEIKEDEFDTHEYAINLKNKHSHNFDKLYAFYVNKYSI